MARRESREAASVAVESVNTEDIPVIDLDVYMNQAGSENFSDAAKAECKKVADCFHRYGIILIRDPRVNMRDNDEYIDLMENYFADVGSRFYAGENVPDIHPEHHY